MTGRNAGPPAVACEGLHKSFGAVAAVRNLWIEVARGEILALLGPSGCGKTTFLRLLAGLERPDAGLIFVEGLQVAGPGVFVPPERRKIGLVFQDLALFPHLTVAGNVGYGLGRDERRAGERTREILDLVGLSGLGGRYPHELSGGQQQRVAVGRALAPSPGIVLLDEPFSNLDAVLRDRVRGEMRDILRAADATAVVVTHDQEEALSLADRVAVMRAGALHQVDTPDRLYSRPADPFVAGFVGGANVLAAVSDGTSVSTPVLTVRPAHPPPPGPALLVLRPESLRLRASADGGAVVARSTFYGHDQVVDVAYPDGTTVRSRVGPGRPFAPGDRVEVSIAADDEALVFPPS